jgi:glucosamine-6-phosphate deaminase
VKGAYSMRIIIENSYEEMSKKAANMVAAQILLKPYSVLGLATGSTPEAMYKVLVKMYEERLVDFSTVTTFNLDEYIGLPKANENGYYYYMTSRLFNHINIKMENVHIPDGMAENSTEECARFEKTLGDKGGLDFQVLGIGNNGHIGFNEPDLKFESTTHIVKLDDVTINANARFFKSYEEVPKQAITMGIKTIMHAKKIILLANGEGKGEVLYKALYGNITPEVPASILQLHPDVTVITDAEAGEYISHGLKQKVYYAAQ